MNISMPKRVFPNGLKLQNLKLPSILTEKPARAQDQPTQEAATSPSLQTPYLTGLRGFLTISLWITLFLELFVPATVKSSANNHGPQNELILRKSLSVLFWNPSLLYSFFIILSARTVALPFLTSPTRRTAASAVFRRTPRLYIPISVALAITKALFSPNTLGTSYISNFLASTGNTSVSTPYHLRTAIGYFNSVFTLFNTTHDFAKQAGNQAFPSQTLWAINVINQQAYTVFMTMIIIPYTRNSWRVHAFTLFILTAWWVQSWAWYTVSGLLLADAVVNMSFLTHSAHGIPIVIPFTQGKMRLPWRLPSWILYCTVMLAGLTMEYLWVAWRPQDENAELKAHTGLYYTNGSNIYQDPSVPQPRDDNYLLILGFMLLLDSQTWIQWLFSNRLFIYLGRRSLSIFLTTPLLLYSAGIKMHVRLTSDHRSSAVATGACAAVCLPVSMLAAEVFYRAVDAPAVAGVAWVWRWILE